MKILHPFEVNVINDQDTFVASSGISDVYEEGATYEQAMQNYLNSLVDELDWLTENKPQLSAVLLERLAFLKLYIATD